MIERLLEYLEMPVVEIDAGAISRLGRAAVGQNQVASDLDDLFFQGVELWPERGVQIFPVRVFCFVIEVGNVAFSPLLQRTPISTEAQYLLMKHAFDDLGYRRYEWKCDALNAPSRKAAARLGFQFEGIFRNHMVMPDGRMRHSAYYSVIDEEWPVVRAGLEQSLAPLLLA